jgi:hypothetical protein
LRNGDFIRIVATEFTNDRQLLVHHIQKGWNSSLLSLRSLFFFPLFHFFIYLFIFCS